jgi:hypothetical protein
MADSWSHPAQSRREFNALIELLLPCDGQLLELVALAGR